MRTSSILAAGVGLVLTLTVASPVAGAPNGNTTPPGGGDEHPAPGRTTVEYFDNGQLTQETRIPDGSQFLTDGARSSSAPSECGSWNVREEEPNPAFAAALALGWVLDADGWAFDPLNPLAEHIRPTIDVTTEYASTTWLYKEVTVTGLWTPEGQGFADSIVGFEDWNIWGAYNYGEQYLTQNFPIEAGLRRFEVWCYPPVEALDANSGQFPLHVADLLRTIEVEIRDPFWNVYDRLGILWNSIDLPPFSVVAPPEVETFGGLVVNMPSWLQIDAAVWRPWFSPVDHYRGWDSQLGLFPATLDFVVDAADGGELGCSPADGVEADGVIPAAPDDLPRYYELGQLPDSTCTWVPQEREVTIRARVTYEVLLTISGYSEWLTPYVWYSDPLTLPAGEVRNVNVTPPGGMGG